MNGATSWWRREMDRIGVERRAAIMRASERFEQITREAVKPRTGSFPHPLPTVVHPSDLTPDDYAENSPSYLMPANLDTRPRAIHPADEAYVEEAPRTSWLIE